MNKISESVILSFILIFAVSCLKENNEPEFEGIYTKSIDRISSSEFEEGLIDAAEKYYPSCDLVVLVAGNGFEIPESKYWYYDSFDGVNIPYAITGDAINYYSGLIDDFNSHKKDKFFLSANFEYKAEVAFFVNYTSPTTNSRGETTQAEEFNSVYVVKMTLK